MSARSHEGRAIFWHEDRAVKGEEKNRTLLNLHRRVLSPRHLGLVRGMHPPLTFCHRDEALGSLLSSVAEFRVGRITR